MDAEQRLQVSPVGHGQQHAQPLPQPLPIGGSLALQETRQRHRGRVPEQGRDGYLPADADAKPVDGLDGLERLPPKVEEIVLDRKLPRPKDLPPDRQDLAFQRRCRRRRFRRLGDRHPLQGGAVDLAVPVAGQPIHEPQIRRDHAGRQDGVELPPQVRRGRPGFVGGKPGRQALHPARQDTADDGGFPDAGTTQQRRFDLPGSHAMAADLELVVDPADEDDLTIRPQLDQIAGPVGPGIPIGQGQRDEALRRQFRPSEIAQRQRLADQMKLAGFAPCRELPGGIDDGGAHAGQRQSDRDLFAAGTGSVGAAYDRGGGDYRGLGRTIGVEERHRRTRRALPAEDRLRQGRLAADDDRPHGGRQSARIGGNRVGQFLPERGGQIENRDFVACCRLHETRQRLHHVVGPHHQGGSGAQRQEDFLDAGVEMQRRELQRAVAGFDPIALVAPATKWASAPRPITTPLGWPVEPEV